MDTRVENVKAALSEVQRLTQIDKCEHGLLLSRDTGKVLAYSQGNLHSVMVPEHPMRDNGQCIFVHSHPGETPMSLPDHCCATANSMPIYAITPQGWVSWTNPMPSAGMLGTRALYRHGDEIHDQVARHMRKLGYWFDLDNLDNKPDAEMWNLGVLGQITNGLLNGQRLLTYRFTAPADTLEKLDKDTKHVLASMVIGGKFKGWAEHACYVPGVQVS